MYHPVGAVDSGGGYECLGAEDTWQISVRSTPFFSEHKTALKKTQSIKKRKRKKGKKMNREDSQEKNKVLQSIYIVPPGHNEIVIKKQTVVVRG